MNSRGAAATLPGRMMKLTPNGRPVSPRVRCSRAAKVAALKPARAVPSMPKAPASLTAAASSGGAAAPMPACWIGTSHPTSLVKRVVSMGSTLPCKTVYSPTSCLSHSTLQDITWASAASPMCFPGPELMRETSGRRRCGAPLRTGRDRRSDCSTGMAIAMLATLRLIGRPEHSQEGRSLQGVSDGRGARREHHLASSGSISISFGRV